MTEQSYRVEWVIDVEADSPLEAAALAWDAMRDEDSIGNVFTVHGPRAEETEIDLNSQSCGVCGKEIDRDDGMWVSRDERLMCRGSDPVGLATMEHVPR